MYTVYYANIVCSVMGFIAVGSSLLVIGQAVGNPVNAVLWLIVAFVAVACYLITAGITFLGLSYIIVYVGAIAVLFLFVVMILNLANQPIDDTRIGGQAGNKMWPVAILIFMTGALSVLPLSHQVNFVAEIPIALVDQVNSFLYGGDSTLEGFTANGVEANWFTTISLEQVSPMNQAKVLGLTLYTYGALWLFIISILLMLAMLVPLALAFTPLIPFSTGSGLIPNPLHEGVKGHRSYVKTIPTDKGVWWGNTGDR